MIQYENVQKAMGVDIAVSNKMSDAIYKWTKMYANEAPWINEEIRSLNLASSICSEMARLVTMESEIKITGSQRADLISDSMAMFIKNLPVYVEHACNGGGIVFKPYIDSQGIAIDIVKAGYFYPVEFDGANHITAVIFPEFKTVGKKLYTRLEYQELKNGRYIIANKAFVSRKAVVKNDNVINLGQEISLEDVPEWADMEPYVEFESADRTLFSYFRMPMANNIDTESPLGVAVYARAVNQIRDADEQYGATMWEYKAKETAIQAADEFFQRDRKGHVILPKGKKRIYHAMGPGISDIEGRPFFNVYSPQIRDESFFNGYNRIVQKIEFNSGLAYGTLSDPQVVEKTAEEIKTSKQRSYATVKAIQNSLEDALQTLVSAIDAWIDIAGMSPPGKVEMTSIWDDSIIVDKETERRQDLQDVSIGAMQLWEYRMKWYGETKEIAQAMVSDTAEVVEK
ncbi:phage portal protein [Bariatricus massiliensis]|nr:hypothetical protein [Bariatricus massiliensis]